MGESRAVARTRCSIRARWEKPLSGSTRSARACFILAAANRLSGRAGRCLRADPDHAQYMLASRRSLSPLRHDHRAIAFVVDVRRSTESIPRGSKASRFRLSHRVVPDGSSARERKPAKVGPELTRRAIDLIAPIATDSAPSSSLRPRRKTMLLQAIVEGVAINHPQAALLVLLVDERPEEVSEMITWGYGEVVASSFDMPAVRHTDVTEMVLERARRLVELGKDVVIVLDSITRMARAYNTVERGTGRTLSGGLDSSAMAKPKAFFGSARRSLPTRRRFAHHHRDALVETVRMDKSLLRSQGVRPLRDQAGSLAFREADLPRNRCRDQRHAS